MVVVRRDDDDIYTVKYIFSDERLLDFCIHGDNCPEDKDRYIHTNKKILIFGEVSIYIQGDPNRQIDW